MAPVPLPPDFALRFRPGLRRPRPDVIIGGSPLRVLRLTGAGAALVDRWAVGRPVGPGTGAGTLAARLVEAGIAEACPPAARTTGAVAPVRAAVVIPVRDDPDGLRITLGALAATVPDLPVLVVDDGSRRPIGPEEVGNGSTLVRRERSGGPAAARNSGFAAVAPDTELVAFVDAGCVPAAGWLDTIAPHFADPGLAAAAPRVTARPGTGTPPALALYEEARSPLDLGAEAGEVRPRAAVPYVPTAVLVVRAEALRRVGGFDEKMRFGEDVDLVWRLHDQGWRVRYVPAATASHPARPDRRSWLRQRFDYGRSAAPLAERHGGAVAPLTVSPWSVVAWGFLAGGRPAPALAVAVGSAEALARRAGGDAAVAGELRRLAVAGTLRAGGPIASALRRAWLPPLAAVAPLLWHLGGWRGRARLLAVAGAAAIGPGALDWAGRDPLERPPGAAGWATWVAWCLADDLAYQSGVWAGVVRERSWAAVLPAW